VRFAKILHILTFKCQSSNAKFTLLNPLQGVPQSGNLNAKAQISKCLAPIGIFDI